MEKDRHVQKRLIQDVSKLEKFPELLVMLHDNENTNNRTSNKKTLSLNDVT